MKVKVTIRNEWETPIRSPAFEPLSTKAQEAEIWTWAVAGHPVQTNVLQTSEAPPCGPNTSWHWPHCFAFFLTHMQVFIWWKWLTWEAHGGRWTKQSEKALEKIWARGGSWGRAPSGRLVFWLFCGCATVSHKWNLFLLFFLPGTPFFHK